MPAVVVRKSLAEVRGDAGIVAVGVIDRVQDVDVVKGGHGGVFLWLACQAVVSQRIHWRNVRLRTFLRSVATA